MIAPLWLDSPVCSLLCLPARRLHVIAHAPPSNPCMPRAFIDTPSWCIVVAVWCVDHVFTFSCLCSLFDSLGHAATVYRHTSSDVEPEYPLLGRTHPPLRPSHAPPSTSPSSTSMSRRIIVAAPSTLLLHHIHPQLLFHYSIECAVRAHYHVLMFS